MKPPAFPALSLLAALALSALAALQACTHPPPPPPPEPPRRDAYGEGAARELQFESLQGTRLSKAAAPRGALGKRMDDPAPLASPWPAPEPGAPLTDPGRKVAYEGAITARSPEPETLIDSADAVARALGGFSEARRKGWIRVRVPAASFDSAFSAMMGLGEIVSHSRQAQDVTEAFQDADLRQQVVGAAIARLEILLQRAKGDAQKLRLIQQLKSYREEWETLEARKRELQKRADFAALTFEVLGRDVGVDVRAEREFPEFRWIRALTPFADAGKGGFRLRFDPPAGFAPTSRFGMWHATSPEGAEMSAWTLRPGLEGGSDFWREAVRLRLAPQFKRADSLRAGEFLFTRFASHGPRAYEYWVGVSGEGKRVRVVEFYFPDSALREKHSEALLAAVRKGPRRW